MEKYFTSYNQALQLKELGFNERCLGNYTSPDNLITEFEMENTPKHYLGHPAPLKSQVFRWFREKHNLHHEIEFNEDEYLAYVNGLTANIFKTYEEAESDCIDKLIEIIKNK